MRKEGTFREKLLYPQKIDPSTVPSQHGPEHVLLQAAAETVGSVFSADDLLPVKDTTIHTWGCFAILFPPRHRAEEGHLTP